MAQPLQLRQQERAERPRPPGPSPRRDPRRCFHRSEPRGAPPLGRRGRRSAPPQRPLPRPALLPRGSIPAHSQGQPGRARAQICRHRDVPRPRGSRLHRRRRGYVPAPDRRTAPDQQQPAPRRCPRSAHRRRRQLLGRKHRGRTPSPWEPTGWPALPGLSLRLRHRCPRRPAPRPERTRRPQRDRRPPLGQPREGRRPALRPRPPSRTSRAARPAQRHRIPRFPQPCPSLPPGHSALVRRMQRDRPDPHDRALRRGHASQRHQFFRSPQKPRPCPQPRPHYCRTFRHRAHHRWARHRPHLHRARLRRAQHDQGHRRREHRGQEHPDQSDLRRAKPHRPARDLRRSRLHRPRFPAPNPFQNRTRKQPREQPRNRS